MNEIVNNKVGTEVEEEEREVIDYVSLGKKMKEVRVQRGKTQDDVGQIFNIDRTVYSKYESGKVRPNMEFITGFSEHFNVPIDELRKKVSVAIPDTCALLKNKRLLHMLLEDYDQVIIPSTVLDELSYQKNRGSDNKTKNIAWQMLANIDYYRTEYSERFKKMDTECYRVQTSARNIENDRKIIELAKGLEKKVIGDVDIITDDVDITTFYDKAVRIDDYVAKRTKTHNYQTVLDLNMEYDHLEYYQKMISQKMLSETDLNVYLPDGMTLLISCIQKLNSRNKDERPIPAPKIYKKIRFLLDNKADPNTNDNGRYCLSPLAHCVQVNDFEAFSILLEYHCDFNKASRDERTNSDLKVGKLNEGNTPLMIACWHARMRFVKKLCELEGISLNQQDSNGYTALIKCAVQRHDRKKNGQKYSLNEDIYQYLIDHGADTLIRDRKNRTAQHWWEMADELD
jgi:ankyrin repeat protein/transcriptional regulator with XRE-family HTH domain